MSRIGFIGLGNMGGPMARQLVQAGHEVVGYDVSEAALEAHRHAGAGSATSVSEAVEAAEFVISMLPAGEHVREVFTSDGGILAAAQPSTLLIDCSTIDVETARAVSAAAAEAGLEMLDAPVSGGVSGAQTGTLTFMVGGPASAFRDAEPVFQAMGKAVVHAGPSGSGQAAKLCNNLLAGISMIAVSEAFVLADKLGLDRQKLFDIVSMSSGQCWSLTTLCPVPGPVPTSPANNDFRPGFAASLMLKDLKLAQQAAATAAAATPLGAAAAKLYEQFVDSGDGGTDYSGIIKMLRSMD